MAKLNPETGLDCVSAGAVRRRQSADAVQSAERKDLAGDQTAEQVKHTPGPWIVRAPHIGSYSPTVVDQDGDCLATVWSSQVTRNLDRPKRLPDDANARLIAAAPDMLAALKALHELYKPLLKYVGDDHIALQWVAAIAAIAKAGGRS